jgi:hypothetical protein
MRRTQRKRDEVGFAVLATAAFTVIGLLGQTAAMASPVATPHALVLSAAASPPQLPAGGGTVEVTGRVENASSCQLELLSGLAGAVVFSHAARSCTTGTFSARVTIGPNASSAPQTIAFALEASNAISEFTGKFYIAVAGAEPEVLAVSASPGQLPASGGTVTVAGRTVRAGSCQINLLSTQSFSVVYDHTPSTCSAGTFSERVSVGANPTAVPRTIAFALVARNGTKTVTQRVYVLLGAPGATTTKTAAASSVPTATTAIGAQTTAPTPAQSENWSGYSVSGGPYTVATGTFTVPSVMTGASPQAQVAEWTGIDGASAGDPSLIQAGADEYVDPQSQTGFTVQAWWEVLPAAATPINSLSVAPGDKVTVTIWKVSATTWDIKLVDDTTGKSFTAAPVQYSGPGATAEWVVEATTSCQLRCQEVPLAPYSPAVDFTGLAVTGPVQSLDAITMVQGAGGVSVPSALSASGFTVSYSAPTGPFFGP